MQNVVWEKYTSVCPDAAASNLSYFQECRKGRVSLSWKGPVIGAGMAGTSSPDIVCKDLAIFLQSSRNQAPIRLLLSLSVIGLPVGNDTSYRGEAIPAAPLLGVMCPLGLFALFF